MSPTTWRLADLYAKHSFLLSGLGWGSMPLHAVERDLAEGRLTRPADAGKPRRRTDRADVGGLSHHRAAGPGGTLADRDG